MSEIVRLFKERHPRRFYGECQRCQRTDYLPWATEHGCRYCGHCYERDALSYAAAHAEAHETVRKMGLPADDQPYLKEKGPTAS